MTTTWRYSDGTTVSLGGNVEGASLFAQSLRADLALPLVLVATGPIPGDGEELDVNNIELMDIWLNQELQRPYWGSTRLLEGPELPEPEPPDEDDDEPGTLN